MKRIILIILILALSALIIYRFLQRREKKIDVTIQQIQAKEGYPVELETAAVSTFRMTREYTGTIVGDEETDIVPMIGEYISEVPVQEGQRVAKGQVICQLSRENPSASYSQAKLRLENAEKELSRVQVLFEQGAVSRQMLDNAKLGCDLAKEGFESSNRLLTISSPISGVLTELKAEVGKFANPGMPLAKVISDGERRIKIEIPSVERDMIKSGMSALIGTGNEQITANVERVSLSADSESRTFTAWLEAAGSKDNSVLKSGVMVEVELIVIDLPSVVTVDEDAIIRHQNRQWLFVADGLGAVRRDVTTGGISNGRAWVISGLAAGEQVVTRGSNALDDGAKLRVIPSD